MHKLWNMRAFLPSRRTVSIGEKMNIKDSYDVVVVGAGPGGNCICPSCRAKVLHQAGVSCYSMSCPKCGIRMVRE